MFHVELRRFPHVARVFNLNDEDVQVRIVLPLAQGVPIELDDRRWTTEKTRLTIYEGPAVAAEDRGLGRGWALVTRDGEDVTRRLLDAARERIRESSPEGLLPQLKRELLAAASTGGVSLPEAVALAGRLLRGRRASESLALAEQAVFDLLRERKLAVRRPESDAIVPPEEWEPMLLAWESWADPDARVHLPR